MRDVANQFETYWQLKFKSKKISVDTSIYGTKHVTTVAAFLFAKIVTAHSILPKDYKVNFRKISTVMQQQSSLIIKNY